MQRQKNVGLCAASCLLAVVIAFAPTVAAQTPKLAVSSKEQSVDDFAKEWRRARKMARACGAPKDYMEAVSWAEGFLLAKKAEEQSALGRPIASDVKTYSLGHEDWFETSEATCASFQVKLEPVMTALADAMQRKQVVLYRAPPVACMKAKPC